MSKPINPAGVRVGDFHLSVKPTLATSGALDTEESRERARRGEEDARAAQRAPGPAEDGAPADMEAAIDAAIAEARGDDDGGEVPILIRDPLTGIVVPQP